MIHYEDLINIMKSMRYGKLPLSDNLMIKAINIYQKNKENIVKMSGHDSIRYSVKSIIGPQTLDCLSGNGRNYAGRINVSFSNKPCIPWIKVPLTTQYFPMSLGDMDHNYCRNPGGVESTPYCYIEKHVYEYCNIPPCSIGFSLLDGILEFNKWAMSLIIFLILNFFVLLYLFLKYSYKILDMFHYLRRRKIFSKNGSEKFCDNYDKIGVQVIVNVDLLDSNMNRTSGGTLNKGLSNISTKIKDVCVNNSKALWEKIKTGNKSSNSDLNSNNLQNSRSFIRSLTLNINDTNTKLKEIYSDIPYIYEESLTLFPVESISTRLFYGMFNELDVESFSKDIRLCQRPDIKYHCLVVSCEDSLNIIKRKYSEIIQPSLISVIGLVFQRNSTENIPRYLILEPVILCDVSELLRNRLSEDWPKELVDIVDILKQVASALEFLQKRRIVHGDIALRNVAVYSQKTESSLPLVKLIDFGKFRHMYKDEYLFVDPDGYEERSGIPQKCLYLPIKWMAPELLRSIFCHQDSETLIVSLNNRININTLSKIPGTLSADIYSFGVMVWELFHNGKKPFDDLPLNYFIMCVLQNEAHELIKQESRGCVASLVYSSMNQDVEQRSNIETVMNHVKLLTESFNLLVLGESSLQ